MNTLRFMVLMCLLSGVAQAGTLSVAYAKPMWLRSASHAINAVKQDRPVGSPSDPSPAAPSEDTVSEPVAAAPLSDAQMTYHRQRFERGLSLHRAGNIMVIAGYLGASLMVVCAALTGDAGLGGVAVTCGGAAFAGYGAYLAGGILSSMGALQATRSMNTVFNTQVGTSVGMVGLVSAIAAGPLLFVGIGVVGPVVSVICSAIQVKKMKSQLSALGVAQVQVVPMPNGLALAARF